MIWAYGEIGIILYWQSPFPFFSSKEVDPLFVLNFSLDTNTE